MFHSHCWWRIYASSSITLNMEQYCYANHFVSVLAGSYMRHPQWEWNINNILIVNYTVNITKYAKCDKKWFCITLLFKMWRIWRWRIYASSAVRMEPFRSKGKLCCKYSEIIKMLYRMICIRINFSQYRIWAWRIYASSAVGMEHLYSNGK